MSLSRAEFVKSYANIILVHIEGTNINHVSGIIVTFIILCRSRKGEVSEEIFDMLLSFTDFLTFKQAMLDYKAVSTSYGD